MREISPYTIRLRKLSVKIILGVIFLIFVSIISLIVYGYFAAKKPVSYLPDLHLIDFQSYAFNANNIEIRTSWYVLYADENGRVSIKTPEGETIISNLLFFAEYEGADNLWGLDNVLVKCFGDSTISITGERPLGVKVNVLLTVNKNRPELGVHIRTLYSTNIIVRREAIVAAFEVPVSEVFLKNRQTVNKSFAPEYWLQRQGVRFGQESRSAFIYHTPSVSSLQLNSEKKLLFVNLEYFLDHPYIHIPYQEDEGGKWINLSTANYSAYSERNNKFSIYFGSFPQAVPRIMLVPNGYLAGYVFTEHADGSNIRTQRAMYFGAENISNIDDAVGGFAGHRIPTTKSVYYTDPGDASGASIRDDPDWPQFLDFLDQLYGTGLYDIGLHTPDPNTSNREMLEESIKFMKERFDASTWIDHGFYRGKLNRESLVCDGLNPGSLYYAADLWQKYNTRYFWSPAVEVIQQSSIVSLRQSIKELKLFNYSVEFLRRFFSSEELKKMNFCYAFKELLKRYSDKEELNSLMPNKGNTYPTPLYWQHPTRTDKFYSWVTNYLSVFGNPKHRRAKEQYYNKQILDKLIGDWGIFINHGYPLRSQTGQNEGYWTERNGIIAINPDFDKMLDLMAHLRNDGDLCITTIKDLLDYWVLTENISFEYFQDGSINVYNINDKTIKGFSLAVRAKTVKVNGNIPSYKQLGNEIIFWFDIPAKDHVRLDIVPE